MGSGVSSIITYNGETNHGQRHGEGVLKIKPGDINNEQWISIMKTLPDIYDICNDNNNKKSKQLTLSMKVNINTNNITNPNKTNYQHGILKYINGCIYNGNFNNNDMHGHGTMKYGNGVGIGRMV